MGNCWGKGKGGWEERKGEGQYTSNLGPGWTRIAPHPKEGFQVSKRGSGIGEGFYQAKGIYQGDCAMYL
jgi:hypothetical protein